MKSQNVDLEQMTFWQVVFSQSKANGARYQGEALPVHPWSWPKDTYLQRKRSARESPASAAALLAKPSMKEAAAR